METEAATATGPRLTRRDRDGTTTWQQPAPVVQPAEEPAEEAPQPTSRRVSFELPDGYMATISLVPYTEPAIEPEHPTDVKPDEAAG